MLLRPMLFADLGANVHNHMLAKQRLDVLRNPTSDLHSCFHGGYAEQRTKHQGRSTESQDSSTENPEPRTENSPPNSQLLDPSNDLVWRWVEPAPTAGILTP